MMTKREEALRKLEEARRLLKDVEVIVITENINGRQFDYCTNSKLSNRIDEVLTISKKIDKIVYQK